MASRAGASNGMLSWDYQATGFQLSTGTSGSFFLETALAMRDGGVWPVIFSYDSTYNVQAYSLYPVLNTQTAPPTYWHQIGTNLLTGSKNSYILSAATSPNGSFGAVLQAYLTYGSDGSSAIVGSSSGGFKPAMAGVRAIAFNSAGGLIAATATTVPSIVSSGGELTGIAASPAGDLGAIDNQGNYYEKGTLLGGWQASSLGLTGPATGPGASCVAMDSFGRPHVVNIAVSNGLQTLIASDFNVMSSTWENESLVSLATAANFGTATIAADGKGGVGVAWVETLLGSSQPQLMYAYETSSGGWPINTAVTNSAYNPYTKVSENLFSHQQVGLAFDANNYPVISYVGASGAMYLAYDPVVVPEPSTLALLAAGGVFVFSAAVRSRRRRLAGK